MAISRSFVWEPAQGDDLFVIPVPFDPKPVFGRINAPVIVEIGGHIYRSTISNMGGSPWVPFRKSNRAAATIPERGAITVTLTLDEGERMVDVPDDLASALAAMPGARATWDALSVTARREYAEGIIEAKRAETRERRIDKAVDAVKARLGRA